MLNRNQKTRHPSLLPLRVDLILAQKGLPPQPAPLTSPDEERALVLIEKMKTEYDKPLSLTGWKSDATVSIFNHLEVDPTQA